PRAQAQARHARGATRRPRADRSGRPSPGARSPRSRSPPARKHLSPPRCYWRQKAPRAHSLRIRWPIDRRSRGAGGGERGSDEVENLLGQARAARGDGRRSGASRASRKSGGATVVIRIKCLRIAPLLKHKEYGLSEAERLLLEEHLSGCEACRRD